MVRRYISVVSIRSLTRHCCRPSVRRMVALADLRSPARSTVPAPPATAATPPALLAARARPTGCRRRPRRRRRGRGVAAPAAAPLDVPLGSARRRRACRRWPARRPVVAEARRCCAASSRPFRAVSAEEARGRGRALPRSPSHPFPTCFACGTERDRGDGPAHLPRPGHERPTRAATWRRHLDARRTITSDDAESARVAAATWAALDCVGGWASDLGRAADRCSAG